MLLSDLHLSGRLFVYSQATRLVAFESAGTRDLQQVLDAQRPCLVYLGGLHDGLLAHDCIISFDVALSEKGWSLVQPLLRSSIIGYGTHSLSDDAQDLDGVFTSASEPVTDSSYGLFHRMSANHLVPEAWISCIVCGPRHTLERGQ